MQHKNCISLLHLHLESFPHCYYYCCCCAPGIFFFTLKLLLHHPLRVLTSCTQSDSCYAFSNSTVCIYSYTYSKWWWRKKMLSTLAAKIRIFSLSVFFFFLKIGFLAISLGLLYYCCAAKYYVQKATKLLILIPLDRIRSAHSKFNGKSRRRRRRSEFLDLTQYFWLKLFLLTLTRENKHFLFLLTSFFGFRNKMRWMSGNNVRLLLLLLIKKIVLVMNFWNISKFFLTIFLI